MLNNYFRDLRMWSMYACSFLLLGFRKACNFFRNGMFVRRPEISLNTYFPNFCFFNIGVVSLNLTNTRFLEQPLKSAHLHGYPCMEISFHKIYYLYGFSSQRCSCRNIVFLAKT